MFGAKFELINKTWLGLLDIAAVKNLGNHMFT